MDSGVATSDKMKACFTPHVLMHSLFGLGLGFFLAHFWTSLSTNVWIGVVLMVVAVVLDAMGRS